MEPGESEDAELWKERAFAFLRPRLEELIDTLLKRPWPEQASELIADLDTRCNGLPFLVSLHDLVEVKPLWFNKAAMEFFGFERDWVEDLDHSFYLQTTHASNTVVLVETAKYFSGDRKGSLDLLFCLKQRTGEYERVYGSGRQLPVEGEERSPISLLFQIPESMVAQLSEEISPEERTSHAPEKNQASPVWHLWRRRIFEERAREYQLTPREMEVVEYVVRGKSDEQIATSLGISKRTAEKHVSNVLTKCRAANRRALGAIWDDLPSRYEEDGSGMLKQG